MKTILILRRHQYLAMASTFLIVLALIAGVAGCDGGGGSETYELTIASTSGGSVTDPGEGVYTYDEGTVVRLIAGADGDYQFASWTGDVGTITNINTATTNITMNGDYSITAEFAYVPLSVPSEWNRVSTPTMEGFVVAPESIIIDYALADDGEVAYTVVEAWNEDYATYSYRLLKSDDYAATWDDITNALEDVDDAYTIGEIVRVATDWEDPDFVAVAVWENSQLRVYFSTGGVNNFIDAGEVEDGGIYFTGAHEVSDLAVSYEYSGARDIAIGGVGSDTYAALFRCTVIGEFSIGWEDATDYNNYEGWDNMWPSDFDGDDIYSELVTDIIFSPSWFTDKTVLVTTIASSNATGYQGVYLQCGSWGTTPGWNEKSTLGIEAVEIKTDNAHNILLPTVLAAFDARTIVGLLLPEDYNSKNAGDRILWVWVNYWDWTTLEPMCDIMRVDDDSADLVGPMGQIEDGELWLTNISYHGTIAEGEAIAGVLGNGGYDYMMGDPADLWTTCCEGVQVYRNDGIYNMDICCIRWADACKPPTGTVAMSVSYVGEDKAYAVALHGEPPIDEGAWSVTFDDGDTWNQLSLIDTYIDYLSDVAVSPDCNKTMLVSVNEEGGYCSCDSVWLHADDLPEAEEYSGKWIRTWCGEIEGYWGLLRLAPEETTGDTVVLVDYDTSNVYWNDMEGLACWDPLGCTSIDHIVELVAEDANTVFALDRYGDVAMFGYPEWQEAVDSQVAYGYTIAVWGDHILVGGEDGDVSYSDDGGETFTGLENVATTGGFVTVAFDSYFDQSDTVYAALAWAPNDDNGVYRWIIGESTEWEDLGAEPLESLIGVDIASGPTTGDDLVEVEFTGLVVDNAEGNPMTSAETGGVLYASFVYYNDYDVTGVARYLTPAEDIIGEECGDWDYLIEGLTIDEEGFEAIPDALKICGCLTPDSNSKLFAIDYWDSYDMCEGEYGTVWTFEDCYAKRAPQLASPAEGVAIPGNPSTCFNAPFGLLWDRLCDAYSYDVQLALDEDFTLILLNETHYLPVAVDAPSYLVTGGQLSCDITYYWRIRAVVDGTGQVIRSWWSEPRSFTIAPGG